jgi:hypothetical protein
MNISILHNELISVGLSISGCDSSGNISWLGEPNESLAALVLAAHEQPLTSDECLALQAAVSEDAWVAYVEARKQPVRALRAARYKNETDAMFLKAFEESTRTEDGDLYILKVPKTNFDAWTAGKNIIRQELPYPE